MSCESLLSAPLGRVSLRSMTAEEEFVDDDPEYDADEDEEDDEIAGLQPANPDEVPPDEGDVGQAGAPEGSG
jgi:hypothetical protein